VLWASESSIYGRFGYGLATKQCELNIERERATLRDKVPAPGRWRLIEEEEAIKVLPDIYERVRRVTPGMFVRTHDWWQAHTLADPENERDGGGPLFRVIWEIDGRAEAYALYRIHYGWHEGLPSGRLEVEETMATSALATREMWRFLFGVDLVARINAHFMPAETPLFHMVTEPRRLRLQLKDGLWLRVVDAQRALRARTYPSDGSLVFEIVDPICAWNAGRWLLEVERGQGRLESTTRDADLRLGAEELGAVYLGGITFSELVQAGRIQELSDGAARAATHMFWSERPPWCPEVF
jgi:predicted acetyltransferase